MIGKCSDQAGDPQQDVARGLAAVAAVAAGGDGSRARLAALMPQRRLAAPVP